MVMLQCRTCGAEVASDERTKKCKSCGELFPFECAVCNRHIRPPVPDFPVERFFDENNKPLCSEHYQRQCPECSRWFRADENPGYFLCSDCTAKRDADAGGTSSDDTASSAKKGGCGASMLALLMMGMGVLYVAQKMVWAATNIAWPLN